MIYIGIDPGKTGAIAMLHPEETVVLDTPMIGKHYDIWGMRKVLMDFTVDRQTWPILATIEVQQAMPKQGLSSTFQTGMGYGIWLGLLAALAIPYQAVPPRQWKKCMHLGADKDMSRRRARELFPLVDVSRKKDHGRAEALLLAYYGSMPKGSI